MCSFTINGLTDGYIALDGDRVGEKLVRSLIANDEQQLVKFANTINTALSLIRENLHNSGYKLLITTGDGVLAYGAPNIEFVRRLINIFYSTSQCNISAGIGWNLRAAYLALKFAKTHGGGKIAIDDGSTICLA